MNRKGKVMGEPNYKLSQGISFEIQTDVGVSEEARLKCEKAIAKILLKDNDIVKIHPVGHYTSWGLDKVIHEYSK
jgi:hypothetical protein